jgi:hypothetical protein
MYYFTSSAVTNFNLTRGMLGASVGGICTVANSTVTAVASSFRIKAITMWPPESGQASLYWATGSAEQALAKDEYTTDVAATLMTVPQSTVFSPPPGSWNGMWQATSDNPTDVICQITLSSGALLRVDLEFTLQAFAALYPQTGYTTATLGAWYYPYLDGPVAHQIKPLLDTTF